MREDHFVLTKRNNGYYYYYVYRWHKRIFRSTGEKVKSRAIEFVLKRIREEDLLGEKEYIRPKTLEEFCRPFFIWDTCPIVQDKLLRGGHYSKTLCDTNRRRIDKYIIPALGKKLLPELTTAHVKTFQRGLINSGQIKAGTANAIFSILKQILNEAVEQALIQKNPCSGVGRVYGVKEDRGCYTLQQVKDLFALTWEDDMVKLACRLAAVTGMRSGEIRALTKDRIREDYIVCDRSYSDKEGLKSTKSRKTRIIPIPEDIRRELLAIPRAGEFIFSYDNGVNPCSKYVFIDKLHDKLSELGIDWREEKLGFHSFRHFFNTQLISGNVNLEKVQSVVGHSSIKMTENYLHLAAEDMGEVRRVQEVIAL